MARVKFAQKKRKMVEVTAVAQAVTMKIAGQYASMQFLSECAKDTLFLSYRQLGGRARQEADTIAEDVLGRMKDSANTKDLRCEVDVHIQGSESIHVVYRTGIEDYAFSVNDDGKWWFSRIQAA